MRKLLVLCSLVVSTTALLAAGANTASASTEVSTFVGCDSTAKTPVPSHECEIGDSPGGYLEANEDLVYDICTKHPNGESVCETDQNSFAYILFGNVIVAKEVGQYLVTWTKTGEGSTLYGSWAFAMRAAGSPPPPTTTPEPGPTTSTTPAVLPSIPSGPSTACLAARARTKVLSAKLKKANKAKKPKIRAKLKKARAAVASAC